MNRLFAYLTAVMLVFSTVGQAHAVVIDFNSLAPGGGDDFTSRGITYTEDGFTLTELGNSTGQRNGFATFNSGEGRFIDTLTLFNNTGNGIIELTVTAPDGGPFDLLSIDLAELNVNNPGAIVAFTGTLSDGGTVTQSFQLDGVPFGLETFSFSGFTNLTSVTWIQQSPFHQFDNIVVQVAQGGPFDDFTINKAEVEFSTHSSPSDSFEVRGEFTLGTGNDDINLNMDDVEITVGTASVTIPAGAFVEDVPKFEFEGTIGGVDVKMEIEQTDIDTFEFKVKAEGVDLTGTANPLDIGLSVGDDAGTASIRLEGELEFEEDDGDDD